jgi:Holliday junction resolvase RusA-like endonuclease
MKITILGEPKPKQSARFCKVGKFMRSYQTKEVKQNEQNIQGQILATLPEGFVPFSEAIAITKLHYVFSPLSSFSKKQKALIDSGIIVYKHTKPDLTDNLSKGLFDAMQGIVFINDSQIVSMDNVKKYYGNIPRIEIELEEIR